MKLTVITSELGKAVSTASRFISPRANLPILGNVVLKAQKAKLMLLATDLEISFSTTIGAKIEDEGALAVPGKSITEIVSNLGTKNVSLESKSETLVILSESFKGNLSGVNIVDFPNVKTEVLENATELQARQFVPAINKVLFATGTDESRPTLTGVLFFMEKENLVLVATDGFRLSQKKILGFPTNLPKTIIPKRVLLEVTRLFGSNFKFELNSEENQVTFADNLTVISSRTIAGDFPNFEKIMPKETKVSISVSKEDFSRAIKLSSVFARDNANTIRLDATRGSLLVSAESTRSGRQEMSIPAQVTGDNFSVSLNFRYIEEFLSVVGGESVEIRFSDEKVPVIFLDQADPDFVHVIAPVRS